MGPWHGCGRWLRGLGFGQYEGKFRDNKIDADLLPRLTADDLKDIDVSALGDRRALARELDYRCELAFIHCLRGEFLLKRDPANPSPAEDELPSRLRKRRARGATSCSPLWRSPSSIDQPVAGPTPVPSSRPG